MVIVHLGTVSVQVERGRSRQAFIIKQGFTTACPIPP